MRAVIQRVTSASVEVDGKIVSEIGNGLMCLIGVHQDDVDADAEFISRKILNLRLWHNEETGKTWDKSVVSMGYQLLCVSQFTLCGRIQGNKPDYSKAAKPDKAREFYERFLDRLRKDYGPGGSPMDRRVQDGVFGAMMKVALVNDGPVTWTLDSHAPDMRSRSSNSIASASDPR